MVRITPFLALSALAASAAARPADTSSAEDSDIHEHLRKFKNELEDENDFCFDWDLSTPEGAHEAWEKTQAAKFLDLWIEKQAPRRDEDWLRHYEELIRGGIDKSITDRCTTIGGTCAIADIVGNCTESFQKSDWPWEQNAFWIFKAVEGLHDQFTEMHNKFYQATLLEGLRIDNMLEDLGEQEPESNALSWLADALGITSTLTGLGAGRFSTALSTLASLLGVAVRNMNDDEEKNYRGEVGEALANACERADEGLQAILRGATGKGKERSEYDDLPQNDDSELATNVGKFFEHGPWLIDTSSEHVRDVMDEVGKTVQKKAAHEVLKANGYYLWVQLNKNLSGDECGEKTGRQYMKLGENFDGCFFLADENKKLPDVEFFNDQMAKYGLGNREPYYKAIFDCELPAKQEENEGGVDWYDDIEISSEEGESCFFEMEVKYDYDD